MALGPKCGEQRLIHCPNAPGGEHHDQQFSGARQQTGHFVALADALGAQEIGEPRGVVLQVTVSPSRIAAVTALPEQGDAPWQRMPVATLYAGIERLERAVQSSVDGVQVIELRSGGRIIAHDQHPSVVFIGWGNRE